MPLPELKKARLRLLRMHFENKIGHIGGNLSCLDAALYLHLKGMAADDVFVLSKGHSAGALYVSLWMAGKIDESQLSSFHQDGTHLPGHPSKGALPGVHFSTGSLGHGLGLAAGRALAKRLKGEAGRVFCLMSDGEWQEGSNWESLVFIAHQRLNQLVALIDLNGLQGFGGTGEVASMEGLTQKLKAFDVDVAEIDGHDSEALEAALKVEGDRPRFIVMRTVKGKGVSFMENKMEWHYLPMNEEQYKAACLELER